MSRMIRSVPPTIHRVLGRLIEREGGFVDHPNDPGGATKYGITLRTLERWRGESIVKSDVKALTIEEAMQIYLELYWDLLNLHHITQWWTREFIFDWAVNGGLKNPVRQIQRLVGVGSDGVIGPVTAGAIDRFLENHNPEGYSRLVDCRVRWYIRLVESRHTHIVFMEGWFNRANEMRYTAPPYQ